MKLEVNGGQNVGVLKLLRLVFFLRAVEGFSAVVGGDRLPMGTWRQGDT